MAPVAESLHRCDLARWALEIDGHSLMVEPDNKGGLPDEDIERLRRVLRFLRGERGPRNKGLRRRDIVRGAGVKPADLDNFLAPRAKGATVPRTQKPRAEFQRRVLRYVLARQEFNDMDPELRNPVLSDFGTLRTRYHGQETRAASTEDDLFLLLSSLPLGESHGPISLIDAKRCKRICNALAGNYYAYRYSATENAIYRSFLQIPRFDDYDKIPRFSHWFKENEFQIRRSEGRIVEIGDKFILAGVTIRADDRNWERVSGIKLLILNKSEAKEPKAREAVRLSGFFLSADANGDYHIGTIRLVGTRHEYDAKNVRRILAKNLQYQSEEFPFPNTNGISIEMPGLSSCIENWDNLTEDEKPKAALKFVREGRIHRSILFYDRQKQKKVS